MFVISQSKSYTWPVKVEFPVNGGRMQTETFDAEFKRLPQSRIQEIHDTIEIVKFKELASEVLVGWKGVSDGSQELPFSEGNKEALLEIAMVAKAVSFAFLDSLSGAKAKN